MTELRDIIKNIEQTSETELQKILQHIMQQVEAFASKLGVDRSCVDYFKTVLRNALMLYLMMEENNASENRTNLEDCIKTVQRIKSSSPSKVEETLFLARGISQEYLLATSIKIC